MRHMLHTIDEAKMLQNRARYKKELALREPEVLNGSPGRIRTYNLSVNSRVLCR